MQKSQLAKILRWSIRGLLVAVAGFWSVFAALSGMNESVSFWQNLPNAAPWLILFVFVFVAWKWEMVGGILVAAIGGISIFMFDAFEEPFVFIAISLPLILLGGGLIWLSKNK